MSAKQEKKMRRAATKAVKIAVQPEAVKQQIKHDRIVRRLVVTVFILGISTVILFAGVVYLLTK